MANKETHVAVGLVCGGTLAYCRSEGQPTADRLGAVIGGLLGGWGGARLPDLIDVPLSPNHRSHAHSVAAGLGIAAKAKDLLLSWESDLRVRLENIRVQKAGAVSQGDKLWLGLMEVLLQIGVGILVGLIAGHASHLALDFLTPKCLPLL